MNCKNCPLYGRPRVPPEGDLQTCKYVLIGEAPGADEARKGRPFVGKTGRVLDGLLQARGIAREDCYFTNAVKCHPPRNKLPQEAIGFCRPIIAEELLQVPSTTPWLLMGRTARDSLLKGRFKSGVLATRGWHDFYGRDVLVTCHPAYVGYNPGNAPLFLTDLARLKRGKQPELSPQYLVIDTLEKLRTLIQVVRKYKRVSFDLETDATSYLHRILCIGIGVGKGKTFMIPDSLIYADGMVTDPEYLHCQEPNPAAMVLLEELFALPGVWVGHNAKFDLRFLKGQLGLESPHCDFDTIVAHYTLDERRGTHGLKILAGEYLDVPDYEAALGKKPDLYSRISRDVLYPYCAMDVEVTLRLSHIFEKELRRQGLYDRPFQFPMMTTYPMLLAMELAGIQIDWKEFERIDEEELEPEINRLKEELRKTIGKPNFNPLSSQQVNNVLYDELQFPIIEVRTRAAGKRIKARSSQVAVLDGWEKMWKRGRLKVTPEAWAWTLQLKEYRHLMKMRGSYVRKWVAHRHPDDRIHPNYQIFGTVTGRLSVVDPPVQTIPSKIRDKWSLMVANAHISKPGWKLVYADYSQGELRVAAALSEDEFMIQSLQSGKDYHAEVARAGWGDAFTHDDRQHAKRLTFGWLFGGNVYEIALKALQFEGDVAKHFAEKWDRIFHVFIGWRDKQGEKMVKYGFVKSVFGRRRRYPMLTRENVGKAKRVAINSPIQSALSDLNQLSALEMHYKYRDTDYARVILLIHDSIVMEVQDGHVEGVARTLEDTMRRVAAVSFPTVPFTADVKVGTRLADLIPLKKWLSKTTV